MMTVRKKMLMLILMTNITINRMDGGEKRLGC